MTLVILCEAAEEPSCNSRMQNTQNKLHCQKSTEKIITVDIPLIPQSSAQALQFCSEIPYRNVKISSFWKIQNENLLKIHKETNKEENIELWSEVKLGLSKWFWHWKTLKMESLLNLSLGANLEQKSNSKREKESTNIGGLRENEWRDLWSCVSVIWWIGEKRIN